MKRNIENDNILKTESGYIITTQKHYSDIIMTEHFIVAYNKKEQELIIYNQNFIMLERISPVSSIIEYRYNNNTVVIAIEQDSFDPTLLLSIHENTFYINKPLACINNDKYYFCLDNVSFRDLKFISPNKFFIMYKYLGNDLKDIFVIVTLKENSIFFELPYNEDFSFNCEHKYHCFLCNRFLVFDVCLYDLYTMTIMEHPYAVLHRHIHKHFLVASDISTLKVCYSSKDILILNFREYYFVYIKGIVVYTYYIKKPLTLNCPEFYSIMGITPPVPDYSEHEEIISALRRRTYSKNLSTVQIKDKIYVWNKVTEPQEISIFNQEQIVKPLN